MERQFGFGEWGTGVMNLRIFISSPGDVADERTFAQQVIEQELPKDPFLRGKVTLDVVRWDDPNAPATMEATVTPQEAVNRALPKPSQCHLVIVILWSRMGTPLPDDYHKPDGTPYDSGTEWEFLDALQGKPAPVVLVYRALPRSTSILTLPTPTRKCSSADASANSSKSISGIRMARSKAASPTTIPHRLFATVSVLTCVVSCNVASRPNPVTPEIQPHGPTRRPTARFARR